MARMEEVKRAVDVHDFIARLHGDEAQDRGGSGTGETLGALPLANWVMRRVVGRKFDS